MNYVQIYDRLIQRALQRIPEGYVERHHIIPRCMGGDDDNTNLVALTPEEHFLAHILLVKIHPDHRNLIFAVQKMTQGRSRNKMYGWLKRRFSEEMKRSQSGSRNSQHGTFWISNGTESKKTKGEIPEGWWRGRNRKKPIKSIQSSYGSRWINDGGKSKILYAGQEIPDGWRYGRINFNLHPMVVN